MLGPPRPTKQAVDAQRLHPDVFGQGGGHWLYLVARCTTATRPSTRCHGALPPRGQAGGVAALAPHGANETMACVQSCQGLLATEPRWMLARPPGV